MINLMNAQNTRFKSGDYLLNKGGFTLLELLVVIAIIGILIGILLPAFTKIKKASMIKKATSDVTTIAAAIRGYHLEFHKWPGNTDGGTWSNQNYLVIRDLANNSKRIFFEASASDLAQNRPVLDPFGTNVNNNSYRINIYGDQVTVWSCGADGIEGSGDEISASN